MFVSLVDILVSLAYTGGNRILGILRVLRLLRTLRPLRYAVSVRTGSILHYVMFLSLVFASVGNVLLLTNVCMSLFAFTRVISRAPGLKLVVETLITSLRPIGNIVLICCAFFIVFGILGVQVACIHTGTFSHKLMLALDKS